MKKDVKIFLSYVIPSVLGMLATSIYIITDGIFIGQRLGAAALSAVNLSTPIYILFIALSQMIASGGATIASIAFARNDRRRANKYFLNSLVTMIIILGLAMGILLTFTKEILVFFGATPDLLPNAVIYLKYLAIFSGPLSLAIVLASFIRNDNAPRLVMRATFTGAALNIILDYLFLFIFNLGIRGASYALGIGQTVTIIMLLTHFVKHHGNLGFRKFHLHLSDSVLIMKTGFSQFIVQVAGAISVFLFNRTIVTYIGERGLASFAIITFIITILTDIFTGISQGIQPLISYTYGAHDHRNLKHFLYKGLITSFLLAFIIYMILYLKGRDIISIFTSDEATINLTYAELKIYAFSFLIAAFNVIIINYYLFITQTKLSIFVSFMRGIFFTVVLTIIIPYFYGASGIWLSINMVEIASLLLILSLEQVRRILRSILVQIASCYMFTKMSLIPIIYKIRCPFVKRVPLVNIELIRDYNDPYT